MEVTIERIAELRKANKSFCVLTVVDSKGATPRKAGARAILFEDGSTEGTVGGGAIEVQAFKDAAEILKKGKPELREYLLENLETGAMKCGGKMTIFYEPVLRERRLTIFGGGHVGRAIAHVAAEAGWSVRVVDERQEVLDKIYFPVQCELINQEYENFLNSFEICENDWIVIVTPQHTKDAVVLKSVINSPAAYIGAMGSAKKIKEMKQELAQTGISMDLFSRVHAPIGLNIGTETPGEIAVAVVAEMLAVLHGIDKIYPCSVRRQD